MKVINLEDKLQVQVHKNKLADKIRKLERQKAELEKLEREKAEKDRLQALAEAKRLVRNYIHLNKSTFKDENEMYEIVKVDVALKQHFKTHYPFVKDMFVGWTDSRCSDRALYFKFKTKTANIMKMVELINDATFYYKRTHDIAKGFFDCRRADEIRFVKIDGQDWLKLWWD